LRDERPKRPGDERVAELPHVEEDRCELVGGAGRPPAVAGKQIRDGVSERAAGGADRRSELALPARWHAGERGRPEPGLHTGVAERELDGDQPLPAGDERILGRRDLLPEGFEAPSAQHDVPAGACERGRELRQLEGRGCRAEEVPEGRSALPAGASDQERDQAARADHADGQVRQRLDDYGFGHADRLTLERPLVGRLTTSGDLRMNFDIKTEQLSGDAYVISLTGEVDLYTAPEFKQQLLEVIGQGGKEVVVDFSGTTFIDSTTLGVLVGGVKRLRTNDGQLSLVCSDRNITKIFEITGLDKV